jgi:hypothetical protein
VKVATRVAAGTLLAGALAAVTAPLAVTGAAPAGAAAATVANTAAAAGRLYGQAFATTRSWSVHYASASTQTGSGVKVTLLESGDAGPASGTQSVYFSRGTANGSISIAVIGGITYVKGDASGLTTLAGLNALQATSDAGKWIDFATSDAVFSQVVAGVRSSDIAAQLALSRPLSLGHPRTLHGIAVLAVEGIQAQSTSGSGNGNGNGNGTTTSTPDRVVLYVRAHGRHLPVEEDSVNAKGQPTGTFHVTYSSWGERVRPEAPQGAVSVGPVTTT